MNPHPSIKSRKKGSKNKTNAEVRELARTYTTVAIKTLPALMPSKKSEDVTRYYAAEALLNRGWGRPATAVTGAGGTRPAQVNITWVDEFYS
jgi:hypothetical protein